MKVYIRHMFPDIIRIVNISVSSADPSSMIEPIRSVCDKEGLNADLFCIDASSAGDDPGKYRELVKKTKAADLVLMRCMTDPTRFKRFEDYEDVLKTCKGYVMIYSGNADVRFMYRDLFKGTDEEFLTLGEYVGGRGEENDRGILYWLNERLEGSRLCVPPPIVQRKDGIYHPDFDRDVSKEEYLAHIDPSKPTVGLFFVGSHWIYRNLLHIDALIRRTEAEGMNIIPVFFSVSTTKTDKSRSTEANVRKYFMDGNRPRIDVLIVNSPFSQLVNSRDTEGIQTPDSENFYKFLTDVPVLQAMQINGKFSDYEKTKEGLTKAELSSQVAWPEVDGQIITVPIAQSDGDNKRLRKLYPIDDRIDHIIRVAKNWASIRRKPAKDRRIAILMYQSRPDSGKIGNAAGLDGVESVNDIMIRMKEEGYTLDHVPENGKALITELLDNITNDLNWTPSDSVRDKATDLITKDRYLEHFNKISRFNQQAMRECWGEPPGTVCVDDGRIIIPGMINGNVYIGYQPLRSWADQVDALYHDPNVVMPHQYLEFYRWLQYDFKADAVVHIGTHGTLEWLPGKNVGLSSKCYPDLVQNGLLDIYPYVIDNPGEGIQAKRRAEAVLIGHMCPTMARAGSYEDLEPVEVPLQEYFKSRLTAPKDRLDKLTAEILDASKKASLLTDLKLPEDITADEFSEHLGELHDYISDVKDTIIRDGLHILGRAPTEEKLDETLYSLTRLRNGEIPSFRNAAGAAMGLNMDALLDDPTGTASDGELNSMTVDRIDEKVRRTIRDFRDLNYDLDECRISAENEFGRMTSDLDTVISYICGTLVTNVRRMTDEMDSMMTAFDGKYVLPGPSGAPTRGNAHILPMGRNYYGIDPDIIPSRTAWKVGKHMADLMIDKYVKERGSYPKEIGFIIWATDTMKTNGDDMAYILWLMGVRPRWSKTGGQVIGLEVVPVDELKRPRIDVTVRITGLFRDTFPNLIDIIDDAVKIVSELDETDEENYLAANLKKDIVENIKSGMSINDANRIASVRVFGSAPGCYGPGVNHAIESGDWKTVQDLADIYAAWGSYGYGRDLDGVSMKDQFVKRFGNSEVTIKNMPDREIDITDIDDVYGYLGGLNAFTRAYGKKNVMSIVGDSSNPDKVKVKDTDEELKFIFRSKVLNPKFLDGLKQHGYRGVGELAKLVEYVFGWGATSDIVDDWMYESMAEKYLFDEETRKWMEEENPYAMMDMAGRLLEAIDRDMWDADEETKRKLQEIYMEAEGLVEGASDNH